MERDKMERPQYIPEVHQKYLDQGAIYMSGRLTEKGY